MLSKRLVSYFLPRMMSYGFAHVSQPHPPSRTSPAPEPTTPTPHDHPSTPNATPSRHCAELAACYLPQAKHNRQHWRNTAAWRDARKRMCPCTFLLTLLFETSGYALFLLTCRVGVLTTEKSLRHSVLKLHCETLYSDSGRYSYIGRLSC